jgi:tRNA(fMet)-specific endonuclease VapC
MADYLVDTNVLSKFFAGNANVKTFLGTIDFAINTIVYIELIQGSIKKQQRELIEKHLSTLTYYPLTPAISKKAIELIDSYSAAKGLFLPDALVAATAIEHDLKLVTFNLKDFKFIKEIAVVEP